MSDHQPPWHPASRYEAQPMVRWMSLPEVARAAYHHFFACLFGSFTDSRETQAALRQPVVHRAKATAPVTGPSDGLVIDPLPWHQGRPGPERVVDYVADVGDGFSPTYAIARLMSRETIVVPADATPPDGVTLPRGSMLVMGGDQVYPIATDEAYRDRTIGPYRTAFPGPSAAGLGEDGPAEPGVPLFAVPGNHDWYDGLGAFLDLFTVTRPTSRGGPDTGNRIGGWQVFQTRSYWAVEVTPDWWFWGIDIALATDMDGPQLRYFREVARQMPPRAGIVLCTAKPCWLDRPDHSDQSRAARHLQLDDPIPPKADSWDRLRYFVNHTVGEADTPGRPRVRLVLTGDHHSYARHEPTDPADRGLAPTMVTAGGGGAYLASTLRIPARLLVPLSWRTQGETGYRLAASWPSRRRSAGIGLSALWRLPVRNPSLLATLGLIYGVFGLAARLGISPAIQPADRDIETLAEGSIGDDFVSALDGGLHSPLGLLVVAVVVTSTVAMATRRRLRRAVGVVAGITHAALHLAAMAFAVALAANLASQPIGDDTGILALAVLWAGVSVIALGRATWMRWHDGAGSWRQPLERLAAGWAALGLLWLLAEPGGSGTTLSAYLAGVALLGSLLGAAALTLYLVAAQAIRINLNELCIALRHEGYKHFVRLRLTAEGIHGYVIGYQRVARRHLRWEEGRPVVTEPSSRAKRGHQLVDQFFVPLRPPVELPRTEPPAATSEPEEASEPDQMARTAQP